MKYIYFFTILLFTQLAFGQKQLPVIYATSKSVAIKDGDYLDKNAWSLSPKIKPDIFTADRTRKTKWVIFYTDIDSIRVKLKPGTKFNFIVLLNGIDSCYTQISSSIPAESAFKINKNKNDTISFILTSYNAIHVKSIINNRDTLNLHFDIGSLDFRLTKDAILKKTKLLSNQPDALTGKAIPDFNKLEKVFKIQIGNLIWYNPEVSPANVAAREMDGRFGWRIFEGKIVEIDYDNSYIIIHSKLPNNKKEFVKSKIKFIHSLFCVEAAIEINKQKYSGNFLFDTGSDLAIILDSSWASKNKFPQDLKLLKKSSFSDGAGRKYETKIVSVPLLQINNLTVIDIPTSILGNKSPVGFDMNYFGNDLLKRFNIIIDLKHDNIYLKSNKLIDLPYKVAK